MLPTGTMLVDAAAGRWLVESSTGRVLETEQYHHRDSDIPQVLRFDLDEWRAWCADAGIDPSGDVYWLALGFWLTDGTREEPEDDFRADIIFEHAFT